MRGRRGAGEREEGAGAPVEYYDYRITCGG